MRAGSCGGHKRSCVCALAGPQIQRNTERFCCLQRTADLVQHAIAVMNGELGLHFRAHCYIGAGGEADPSLKWGDAFMRLYLVSVSLFAVQRLDVRSILSSVGVTFPCIYLHFVVLSV